MKTKFRLFTIALATYATQATTLELAPEEFAASRQLACVLAQQSLGQLSEDEYGRKANSVLDGFDDKERDNILAQAVGYYGGLIFSPTETEADRRAHKLEDFVSSSTCSDGYSKVTVQL